MGPGARPPYVRKSNVSALLDSRDDLPDLEVDRRRLRAVAIDRGGEVGRVGGDRLLALPFGGVRHRGRLDLLGNDPAGTARGGGGAAQSVLAAAGGATWRTWAGGSLHVDPGEPPVSTGETGPASGDPFPETFGPPARLVPGDSRGVSLPGRGVREPVELRLEFAAALSADHGRVHQPADQRHADGELGGRGHFGSAVGGLDGVSRPHLFEDAVALLVGERGVGVLDRPRGSSIVAIPTPLAISVRSSSAITSRTRRRT